MRQQAGIEHRSPRKPSTSSQKESERRGPADDYDVANTIVDGSTPMQSALLRSQAQGKERACGLACMSSSSVLC